MNMLVVAMIFTFFYGWYVVGLCTAMLAGIGLALIEIYRIDPNELYLRWLL